MSQIPVKTNKTSFSSRSICVAHMRNRVMGLGYDTDLKIIDARDTADSPTYTEQTEASTDNST